MIQLSTTEEGLVVLTATGKLTPADVASAYSQLLETAPNASRVLWDLRGAALDKLRVTELTEAAPMLVRIGKGRHVPSKSAVVCRDGVDFGVVRMFLGFVSEEEARVEFEVFCDATEARTWLKTGEVEQHPGPASVIR